MPTSVAVLGTGVMGAPMARNARAGGLDVHVWSRPLDDAERLRADGIVVHPTAASAAAAADICVTMVPDEQAILSFALGEDGFLPALRRDAVWVQSGTVGVAAADRLVALASSADVRIVDAPVVGSKEPAEAGELVVLASGDDDAIDVCAPYFECIARLVLRVGRAGAGSRLKIVANNWIMTAVAGIAETFALADALGVDGRDFLRAIDGSALDMGYVQSKGRMILDGEYAPQMQLTHAAKDAHLAETAQRAAGLAGRAIGAAAAVLDEACRLGHADRDMAAAFHAARAEGGLAG